VVVLVAKVAACCVQRWANTADSRRKIRLPTVLLPAAGAGWYSEDGHERIRHS
jgi:hypothetical protein